MTKPERKIMIIYKGKSVTVQPDKGCVIWASDWSTLIDMSFDPNSPVTQKCYGPSTYNHTSIFLKK